MPIKILTPTQKLIWGPDAKPAPRTPKIESLTPGLTFHCDACKVVIPSDAPRPDGLDSCAPVAHLARYAPNETPAAQHVMAAAAWSLIYDRAHSGATPHAPSAAYKRRIHPDRKNHFGESAVRKAMTDDQVKALAEHKRDGWLVK